MLLIDIGLLQHFAPFCDVRTRLTLQIVPVTIVDPRAYNPQASPTAQRIGQVRLSDVSIMGMSQVSRWYDVTSVGNIEAMATFDRAEQAMFNPEQTDAMGICAMSRAPSSLMGVLSQGVILDAPVFGLSLSRIGRTADTGGTLSLGWCRRGLRYVPLEQAARYAGLWAIRGDLNGIPWRMILASGSPVIILPIWMVRLIFDDLDVVVQQWDTILIAKYNCARPPVFRFRFRLNFVIISGDSVRFSFDPAGLCISSIIGEAQTDITLGLPFFRSAYVAFDLSGRATRFDPLGRVGIGIP
ncbi:hypothetical protein V8E36_006260 [Tilletia maclaganii]